MTWLTFYIIREISKVPLTHSHTHTHTHTYTHTHIHTHTHTHEALQLYYAALSVCELRSRVYMYLHACKVDEELDYHHDCGHYSNNHCYANDG